ncbi:class I SAM-dependent methyltransferase [Stieleria sp. TO1_6]|uniref:class I SAM-dependent methyltransferase n=1 Tax=Stieleria tagensis TaxID=2956795 RepID=UPI00209B5F23|nr:class I SAM-dependent methyltransferase [Stieleria tagensis]MCO8123226.1 class I SAM-dependent methyltransferase [Stieleria tagensis]
MPVHPAIVPGILLRVAFVVLAAGHLASLQTSAAQVADAPATAATDLPDATGTATGDAVIETTQPADAKPIEKARESYLGRVVAQPMSHRGASWLIRPNRDEEENASESFQNLGLEPGMVVCDLGCGNGYWTLPMARKVGEKGAVYAVDIQQEMLRKLNQRADRFELKNIRPVLGTIDNPKLPVGAIDMLLMVDVYHEFSHPESMLWEIRRALKPTGVIALLEYREEDLEVPIKPLHKMSKRQIMKEYQANGFKLVREYNELPWQHLMFFARDDSPLAEIEPEPADAVLKRLQSSTPNGTVNE